MDKVFFNIKEVAQKIGVVPATIRNWEKQGLFEVKRSENGYRIFDYSDIEKLQEIKECSKNKNMGIEAIRMLYGNQNEHNAAFSGGSVSRQLLSEKWKEQRLLKGYTLEEVADAVMVSPAHLSKIENMQTNISMDVLNRLADFYGTNVLYYLEDAKEDRPLVKKGEGEEIGIGIEGVSIRNLLARKTHGMSCLLYRIEPGSRKQTVAEHGGEEFIYLLSGEVTFFLGDERYLLHPGDSLSFSSSKPHRWENNGRTFSEILWLYHPVK